MGEVVQGFLPNSEYEFSSILGKTLQAISVGFMFVVAGAGAIAELAAGAYLLAVLFTGGSVGSWGTALVVLILGAMAPLAFAIVFGLLAVVFAALCYPFERPAIKRRQAETAEEEPEQEFVDDGPEGFYSFDPDFHDHESTPAQPNESIARRFCSQCGYRFEAQDRFCPDCGVARLALNS